MSVPHLLDALRALNLFLGAAAAGGAVYEAALILPAARSRPVAAGVELLRELRLSPHRNPGYRYLVVTGFGSLIAAAVVAAFWNRQPQSAAVLNAVGLALYLAAAVVDAVYWSYGGRHLYGGGPVDEDVLERQANQNLLRTAIFIAGFAVFAIATAVA